jgi:SM-20-related protein
MDAVVDGLAQRGYAVVRDALPAAVIAGLRERVRQVDLVPARIGRGDARQARTDIRGDRIAWLRESPQTGAEASLVAWLDAVRAACNCELMLGLVDFEGHYAAYPPGSHYARHRDRFRDDDARVVSCVLYLNDAWRDTEGGALRLHVAQDETLDVLPKAGTFVAFLSGDFDHEVLPATRERLSVAVWFRRRPLT